MNTDSYKTLNFEIESPYPRIIIFKNIIDSLKCKEIIIRFEHSGLKKPGTIGYPPSINDNLKRTSDISLNTPEFRDIDELIYNVVQPCLKQYIHIMDANYQMNVVDGYHIKDTGYHIQKYEPNGFYREHNDFHVDFQNGLVRIITFIIYLNTIDEDKGGKTLFSHPINCGIRPIEGSCLFFPATWDFVHQGETCLTDKYIITGWFSVSLAENNSNI